MVDGTQLQVDSSCAVNLSRLGAVECQPSSSLLVPLACGIGGLLGIVLLTLCCCLAYRLALRRKRKQTSRSTRYVSPANQPHAVNCAPRPPKK